MEQHQGQQSVRLRLAGQELGEQPRESDRLDGQGRLADLDAHALSVSLGEDEVEHEQHRGETLGEFLGRGHLVGDVRRPDGPLGTHQPLGDGRFGDQEGTCDGRGLDARDRPQRERHPRLGRQRRVATGEDEPQPIIGDGLGLIDHEFRRVVRLPVRFRQNLERRLLLNEPPGATDAVDGPVSRGGRDPGARPFRDPVAGPGLECREERILDGFLGGVEVAAKRCDETGQDAPAFGTEDLLDREPGRIRGNLRVGFRHARSIGVDSERARSSS